MVSVPVHCEAHGGWGMLHGVVHLEENGVRLEYQTGDAVIGLLRSASKEMMAGFEALAGVRFRAGFFWMFPKIELEFSDFKLVSQVPAGYAGTLLLNVPRPSRAMARKFVDELEGELSHQRRRRLEQDIERLSRTNPGLSDTGTQTREGGDETSATLRALSQNPTGKTHAVRE